MPVYEWTGVRAFRDSQNDRLVQPGDVVELSEHVGGPHREFVKVEDAEQESEQNAEDGDGLPDLSGSEWQSLAAAYEFEDVNGQSSADDIQAAFEDLSDEEQSAALDAFESE